MAKKDLQQSKLAKEISQLILNGGASKAIDLAQQFKREISDPDLLLAVGKSYYFHSRYDESVPYLEQAYRIDSKNTETRQMLWSAYRDSKHYTSMLQLSEEISNNIQSANEVLMVYRAYLGVCDWHQARAYQQQVIAAGKRGDLEPDMLPALLIETCGLPDISQSDIRDLHDQFGNALIEAKKHHRPSAYPALKNLGGRLKIAYLSADFNFHPVGCFINHVITNHLHEQFEIYCYAHLIKQDEVTERIRNHVDHFIDVTALSDADLAVRMHADGIHIAVDLNGLTTNTRVAALAHQPAPVQITYLGYPNTTGISSIDYRITDPFADQDSDKFYAEKLIRMPQSFICYGFDTSAYSSNSAPSETTGYITFGSFNHVRKLNPEVIETWSAILKRVSNSRLILKAKDLSDDVIRKNIIREFTRHGISEERLHVQGFTERYEDNFKMYNDVDIALDTFPYNGTTTTCDALSIGVPVLTLVGEKHAQRVSYSILKNIGFEESIAYTREEYIEKAVQLAQSPESLSTLRRCLVTLFKHSILRQPVQFTRQLEALLSKAWLDKTNLPLPAAVHYTEKELKTDMKKQPEQHPTATTLGQPITIAGDVQIIVPDNLNLMTPYVLTEQQDWFEDEIKFIRTLIKPGMKIIDIGANYGCYAMTAAKLIGERGRLWAFEPASSTAGFLAESISTNGFKNTTLIKAALSDHKGAAELSLDANSELNSITTASSSGQSESVPLMRLDDCIKSYQWDQIDFVKMDAEGEEIHILDGGSKFFNQFSPLVMFELKHGEIVNEGLIQKFEGMGYDCYILVPGLNFLAPFNHSDTPDGFLLNLFCCKKDTAQQLASDGILVSEYNDNPSLPVASWRTMLSELPYAQTLMDDWNEQVENAPLPGWDTYELALNHYVDAYATERNDEKLSHLQQSFIDLVSLLDIHVTLPRLMSLARVATELGQRSVAVQILNQMAQFFGQQNTIHLTEPFLAVSNEVESIAPDGRTGDWCLAGILGAKEKLQAFSSYFTGKSSLDEINIFLQLGFPDAAMQRRQLLIQKRFPQ